MAGQSEDEGLECSPARWVVPGECQWLAGFGLDTRGRVVDNIVTAALRSDECGKGQNDRNPGAHGG